METSKTLKTCLVVWVLFSVGLSAASSSFQDEKNFYFYYTPYPNAGSPPLHVSHQNPPPAVANDPPVVYYQNPPPAHANNPPAVSNPPPAHANNPPPAVSYKNPLPVEGNNPPPHRAQRHHGHKPPTNCGTPPPLSKDYGDPTPTPPTGYHNTPTQPPVVKPPAPSGGCTCRDPPPAPTKHHNPPPVSPSTPGYHHYPPPYPTTPPSTPYTIPPSASPPTDPTSHPPPAFPSPPSFPNIPFIGGTCDFWRTHPHLLSDLFSWWRTVGQAMGIGSIPGMGTSMSLQEALTNSRTDGISELYREGTASLLNSMVNKNFPYTTSHVVDSFVAALASNKVAAAQARLFKLANEGQLKPRV